MRYNRKFPKFKNLGGMHKQKQKIKEIFLLPNKYHFIFQKIPIKLSQGILLYGPPGNGKTLLAQATANELNMNFFTVKGAELLNKYIGASEENVRDIFEKAQQMKPAIIFFDEFDALVPKRNQGSTQVTDRIVNQFLCYLDGIQQLDKVYILAASSRPELIDPALLRPGRIDQHIFLGFPNKNEREEIIQIYFEYLQVEGISSNELAEMTDCFSISDIVALIKELHIKSIHENIIYQKKSEESLIQNIMERKSYKQLDNNQQQQIIVVPNELFKKVFCNFNPSYNKEQIVKITNKLLNFRQFDNLDILNQKQLLQ